MRKVIALLAIVLVCFACKQNKSLDGVEVVLVQFNQVEVVPVDTAIIKNMKFSFDGKSIEEGVYYIISDNAALDSLASDIKNGMPIYLNEKGLKGEITEKEIILKGNPYTEAFSKLSKELKSHYAEMNLLYDEAMKEVDAAEGNLPKETEDRINGEFALVGDKIKKSYSDYFDKEITNPLGEEAFLYYISMGAFDGLFTETELEEIVNKGNESFLSNPMILEIKAEWEDNKRIGKGAMFTDFETKDINGKTVRLSDIAGKGDYVLIDFWASWCGPCLREMPVLQEAYNQFNGKNFKIISISVDAKETDWKDALTKLKLPWIQWGYGDYIQEAASIYKVASIPHTILLDPNGIIIEKNLRGEETINTLDALLNQ